MAGTASDTNSTDANLSRTWSFGIGFAYGWAGTIFFPSTSICCVFLGKDFIE